MRPIVGDVRRFIADGPTLTAEQASARCAATVAALAQVEARDGRPPGSRRIHTLLVWAMDEEHRAIRFWLRYHDPDRANDSVFLAARYLPWAEGRLRRVPCVSPPD